MFLVTIFMGCKATTESLALDDECIPIINSFFDGVRGKGYDQALLKLLGSNGNINLNDSSTLDLRQKFANINELSGTYLGFKIIK